MAEVHITYRFTFSDGRKVEHKIAIDSDTTLLIPQNMEPPPAWTLLENQKCSHCPLKKETSPHCPVAKNLSAIATDFKDAISYEKVTAEVITEERTFHKELQLQEALFGLFGLVMAVSGCPYLKFLSPMARFHLPFSTFEETMARSVSFYLLRQYFVAKNGGTPDFELKEFAKLYANLDEVNIGMTNRIRTIAKRDAQANSIVTLDSLAKLLSSQVSHRLTDLEKMFTS